MLLMVAGIRFGYCYQIMCCFVEDEQALFCPTLGKRLSFECLEHVCDTACVMVSVCSEYCCPSLNCVDEISSCYGVSIQNGAAIF